MTATSVCPDTTVGPCAGQQLYPTGAPRSWPVKHET
jgi:hypothetical protein